MKHLLNKVLVAMALFASIPLMTFAQQQVPPIPIDANVRIGKLDNGLTYYIRHNENPKERVDFYIAQKVGSILEEESQRGLAHFLEHMCFAGTKNFPGKNIINYLEGIGVKFGENLNAYTSIDETVYNISNVPATREPVVDSCLLILHDWANDLLLLDKAIDDERGIIHEEWRTRNNANQRNLKGMCAAFYKDSRYANRMPIGLMEVVDNFPYERLRAYYAKWYRPDQQGIVVVGDIDVDQVETKIKALFSPIKMPENAAKREYFTVADNKEPIVHIGKDKEQQYTIIRMFQKHEITPVATKKTMAYLAMNYARDMILNMLNARLTEKAQLANPPYLEAGTFFGEFLVSKTKDALGSAAVCKENAIMPAFKALLTELERARQHGFTATEYVRAKAEYLRQLETAYNDRSNNKNEAFAQKYVRNFIDNEPIPGIESRYAIMNQITPNIPIEAINEMTKQLISNQNVNVAIFGPDKEGVTYPTEADIMKAIQEMENKELAAYEDNVSTEPLMKDLLTAGKVVAEKEMPLYDAKELTLSNGVKVILKKTEFKKDQISMNAVSKGGNSLFNDENYINFSAINDVITLGGLGNFSKTDLEKMLAGKLADVTPFVGQRTEGLQGSCSPKDFETFMQLVYLNFTAPRMDKDAFTSYQSRKKAMLKNKATNPSAILSDSIQRTFYGDVPRTQIIKSEDIDKIDYAKAIELYKDRFKDASDFTFIFVGDIDEAKLIPILEQYLGSLPAINRKETFKTVNKLRRKGTIRNEFEIQSEVEKTTFLGAYSTKMKYNLKNVLTSDVLQQVLSMVCLEEIRTKESGTYGVSVFGGVSNYPESESVLLLYFDTDPAKKDKLIRLVLQEVEKMAKEGPKAEMLEKVKKFMLKKHAEEIEKNGYWSGTIKEYVIDGIDLNKNYQEIVEKITAKDLKKLTKTLLKNRIDIIMNAKKK